MVALVVFTIATLAEKDCWTQTVHWAIMLSKIWLHITPFADHLGEKDIHFREV